MGGLAAVPLQPTATKRPIVIRDHPEAPLIGPGGEFSAHRASAPGTEGRVWDMSRRPGPARSWRMGTHITRALLLTMGPRTLVEDGGFCTTRRIATACRRRVAALMLQFPPHSDPRRRIHGARQPASAHARGTEARGKQFVQAGWGVLQH